MRVPPGLEVPSVATGHRELREVAAVEDLEARREHEHVGRVLGPVDAEDAVRVDALDRRGLERDIRPVERRQVLVVEVVDARDVGPLGLRQRASRIDHVAGDESVAGLGRQAPEVPALVERGAGDLRAEARALTEAVARRAVLGVPPKLLPGSVDALTSPIGARTRTGS